MAHHRRYTTAAATRYQSAVHSVYYSIASIWRCKHRVARIHVDVVEAGAIGEEGFSYCDHSGGNVYPCDVTAAAECMMYDAGNRYGVSNRVVGYVAVG